MCVTRVQRDVLSPEWDNPIIVGDHDTSDTCTDKIFLNYFEDEIISHIPTTIVSNMLCSVKVKNKQRTYFYNTILNPFGSYTSRCYKMTFHISGLRFCSGACGTWSECTWWRLTSLEWTSSALDTFSTRLLYRTRRRTRTSVLQSSFWSW